MTIQQLISDIRISLRPLYDEREAAAVASWYVCARLGMQRYELALRGQETVDAAEMAGIERDMEKLRAGCPVQYVLGETEFYGLPFKVSPAVLIPRPETEELVQMVVDRYARKAVKIWDVGTGSGCIAVSLAKILPDAEVFATDISAEALAVSVQNADMNGVEVTFARHDMMDAEHLPFETACFDVVVSNPPYIPASDRATMHRNVVDYEPETALFVPDDDKFRYYAALALLARRALKPDGRVYLETYHDFHEGLADVFRLEGFSTIQSLKDLNGRLRFMVAMQ